MQQPMDERITMVGVLALALLLLLACAPSLWSEDGQPPNISPDWQCPTPSPDPTEIVGYLPTPVPADPSATTEATGEPIYSTPMPTATPYIRLGGDYFMGQRVKIGEVMYLAVTGYRTEPAPSGEAYHLVTIQIENRTGQPLAIFFDLSTLRSVTGPDGRMIAGLWSHDATAAARLGIQPASDPPINLGGDQPTGGYPPGVTERTLVFTAPAGEARAWGIALDDHGRTTRAGSVGDGQIWFVLRRDPHCTQPGGGASEGQPIPPAGTPAQGSGRYPTDPRLPITRGFGCHGYFTGTRGAGCPADAPWWHDGIDLAGPKGSLIFATRDLTIDYAGRDTSTLDCRSIQGSESPHFGFGQYIRAHDDLGYVYWFGHLASWRVATGERVPAGTEIGRMGSTGCSTGSHLHFRVRLGGRDVNPFDVISK